MPTTIEAHTGGTRAYPILEGVKRLGVGTTTAYAFIKSGELETFLVGRARFVTEEALQKFIRSRVAASAEESPGSRVAKVEKAIAGRARQRAAA